eukprot:6338191-Pyramimonas_sp.AAC.1
MCGGDWDDEDVVETHAPAGAPDEVGDASMPTTPHRVWPRQTPRLAGHPSRLSMRGSTGFGRRA